MSHVAILNQLSYTQDVSNKQEVIVYAFRHPAGFIKIGYGQNGPWQQAVIDWKTLPSSPRYWPHGDKNAGITILGSLKIDSARMDALAHKWESSAIARDWYSEDSAAARWFLGHKYERYEGPQIAERQRSLNGVSADDMQSAISSRVARARAMLNPRAGRHKRELIHDKDGCGGPANPCSHCIRRAYRKRRYAEGKGR